MLLLWFGGMLLPVVAPTQNQLKWQDTGNRGDAQYNLNHARGTSRPFQDNLQMMTSILLKYVRGIVENEAGGPCWSLRRLQHQDPPSLQPS